MKYRITIQKLPDDEDRYKGSSIYEQTAEDIDLQAVIRAFNGMPAALK